jgi:hypothetical protein
LSEVAEEVRAEDFQGTWFRQDPNFGVDDDPVQIVASPTGGCQILDSRGPSSQIAGKNKSIPEGFDVKLISAAGLTFIELGVDDSAMFPTGKPRAHLASVERRGNWIAIRQFDEASIKQYIRNGVLKGRIAEGILIDDIVITADAKELEEFLSTHGDEVFEDRYELYQLKSE